MTFEDELAHFSRDAANMARVDAAVKLIECCKNCCGSTEENTEFMVLEEALRKKYLSLKQSLGSFIKTHENMREFDADDRDEM